MFWIDVRNWAVSKFTLHMLYKYSPSLHLGDLLSPGKSLESEQSAARKKEALPHCTSYNILRLLSPLRALCFWMPYGRWVAVGDGQPHWQFILDLQGQFSTKVILFGLGLHFWRGLKRMGSRAFQMIIYGHIGNHRPNLCQFITKGNIECRIGKLSQICVGHLKYFGGVPTSHQIYTKWVLNTSGSRNAIAVV